MNSGSQNIKPLFASSACNAVILPDQEDENQTSESDSLLQNPEARGGNEQDAHDDSGDTGTSGFFDFSGLSPAFTAQAYARHITDQVRDLAIQRRYDEAIDLGNSYLVKNSNRAFKDDGAHEIDLRETLDMTEDLKNTALKPGQQQILSQTPTMFTQSPPFHFSGGKLSANFDAQSISTRPAKAMSPAPAPAHSPTL